METLQGVCYQPRLPQESVPCQAGTGHHSRPILGEVTSLSSAGDVWAQLPAHSGPPLHSSQMPYAPSPRSTTPSTSAPLAPVSRGLAPRTPPSCHHYSPLGERAPADGGGRATGAPRPPTLMMLLRRGRPPGLLSRGRGQAAGPGVGASAAPRGPLEGLAWASSADTPRLQSPLETPALS